MKRLVSEVVRSDILWSFFANSAMMSHKQAANLTFVLVCLCMYCMFVCPHIEVCIVFFCFVKSPKCYHLFLLTHLSTPTCGNSDCACLQPRLFYVFNRPIRQVFKKQQELQFSFQMWCLSSCFSDSSSEQLIETKCWNFWTQIFNKQ